MKKLVTIVLAIMLMVTFMCSCTGKNKVGQNEIVVDKNVILRNNLKSKLADKYNYVYEVTTYKFDDAEKNHSWHFYYEKANDSYNAILIDGAYECYYYDNSIYFTNEEFRDQQGNVEYRTIVPLNEKYDSLVEACLVDDTILKSVFITSSHAEKTPDGGYIATFEYVATNSVANDFEMWDIKPNQQMCTVYNLNKDYEINKVKYYKYVDDKKVLMGETDYFYGKKTTFPERIMYMHNSMDKVKVKIIQNYGTGSAREDVYYVPQGTRIFGNNIMMNANITKDASKTEKFDFNSYISEDTVLYASLYR